MSRRKRCRNFLWRDEDPTYQAERDNDRTVFRKIKRELNKTPVERQSSIVRLVRLLSINPLWGERLRGKSPESWKRTYNRWRQKVEKRDSVQAEKSPFDPHQPEPKTPPEKFYQETGVQYPRPHDMVSAANKGKQMKSYQQATSQRSKKTGRKRETSPYDPYKRKARGKETSPGCLSNPSSPRGRTRKGVSRYREAGAAAEELIQILGANPTDYNRRLWAFYCYHHDIETIIEKALRCASERRQGEIRDPVRKFQKWLKKNYGKEAT